MKPEPDLAGRVRLHPGRPLPTVSSSRPDAASRLARGRRADDLPALMGALFTLCGGAHRLASRLAVAAARGEPGAPDADEAMALRLDTAREQVLRITHDWPRQFPGAAAAVVASDADPVLRLRGCPLWRAELAPAERLSACADWLHTHWLGMAPDAWLARAQAEPGEGPLAWCHRADTAPARLLRPQAEALLALRCDGPALDLLHQARQTMPMLARAMHDEPGFCARPRWQAGVPDTGPWTRHHATPHPRADNAWMRVLSRLTDVLHLVAPGGEHWLAHGSLALGPGEGIAWVEMARGLLVHAVRLEPAEGREQRVADARVLAPTEWNFHPEGVLARALSGLRGPAMEEDARRLALAFDPCVPFDIERPAPEVAHA